MSLIEEKSAYSRANLVFVAKMSDGKFFNGLLDKSLKNKKEEKKKELLEKRLGTF